MDKRFSWELSNNIWKKKFNWYCRYKVLLNSQIKWFQLTKKNRSHGEEVLLICGFSKIVIWQSLDRNLILWRTSCLWEVEALNSIGSYLQWRYGYNKLFPINFQIVVCEVGRHYCYKGDLGREQYSKDGDENLLCGPYTKKPLFQR